MSALCRDCLTLFMRDPQAAAVRCPNCHSPRLIDHPELDRLAIAHVDCDAFYASVEKRDNPALRDLPVIVGGGTRGVVSTCCYIARIRGVRSAMPMFQALKLCPDAVVIKPRMQVYAGVSRQIRALMEALTPLVEPLSLDEAFLDLSGTARLHGAPPCLLLARLVRQIESELGITASVGLSHNKFLAKIASDLDKPRGYAVIGREDTASFLRGKPVRILWGVGTATQAALEAAGIRRTDDLLRWERTDLAARFGQTGSHLWHLARGEDSRPVERNAAAKSISRETTFDADTADREVLDGHLWRLAEQVADRAKAQGVAGRSVMLKLRRSDFTLVSRRRTLQDGTQTTDRIYREVRALLEAVPGPGPLRLIGIGLADLGHAVGADGAADLLDPDAEKRRAAERATDLIRARFGPDAIFKGRALH